MNECILKFSQSRRVAKTLRSTCEALSELVTETYRLAAKTHRVRPV